MATRRPTPESTNVTPRRCTITADMASREQLELVARAAHVYRPEWAWDAVVAYLERNYTHEPYQRLAAAVATCATDPEADTIGRLRTGGARYWPPRPTTDTTHAAEVPRRPCPQHDILIPAGATCPLCLPGYQPPRCTHGRLTELCGHCTGAGEQQPGDPHAGAQRCRQAIAAATH